MEFQPSSPFDMLRGHSGIIFGGLILRLWFKELFDFIQRTPAHNPHDPCHGYVGTFLD